MKNNLEFDTILNECLDKMFQGETIERCLRRYPEYNKELEPLLRTALAARVLSSARPNAGFKVKARNEFLTAVNSIGNKPKRSQIALPWHWRWQSGWAIATFAVFVLLIASGSTVAFARNSMPDNALYPVKLAAEQIQMTFTFSDFKKAELRVTFAETRVQEMVYAANSGNPEKVQIVALSLNNNLKSLNDLINNQYPSAKNSAQSLTAAGTSQAGTTATQPDLSATHTPSAFSAPMLAPVPAAPPAPEISMAQKSLSGNTENNLAQSSRSTPGLTSDNLAAPNSSGAGNSALSNTPGAANLDSSLETIKQVIAANSVSQENQLNAALATASPQVRPALRQALAQSTVEYEKALNTLNQAQTGQP